MATLKDTAKVVQTLNRDLRETLRLMPDGGPAGAARGASTTDIRRLRGDIRQLGQMIGSQGGGRAADPFLSDLGRGSGPRRA